MKRPTSARVFVMSDEEADVQDAINGGAYSDPLSREGAYRLKSKIERAWIARGENPPRLAVYSERVALIGDDHDRIIWIVRSKMIDGRP